MELTEKLVSGKSRAVRDAQEACCVLMREETFRDLKSKTFEDFWGTLLAHCQSRRSRKKEVLSITTANLKHHVNMVVETRR
mmetsp:Transcript_11669/g.43874  ORF Transcript_11669/g.43874 Transcript_11669/m.43874 type:complete len:81 (+) Transcript_11669:1863-2105(+)